MTPYNPLKGVPLLSYYLIEIKQFADFETPQIEEILFTSRDKQELIDLCHKNKWAIDSLDSWNTHYIKYKLL